VSNDTCPTPDAVGAPRAAVGVSSAPTVADRGRRRMSARGCGLATLAILAVFANGARARALTLSGGPTLTPPGGVTCSQTVDQDGSGLTLNCTVANPGVFADLYFGLANNSKANGVAMDGSVSSAHEIFRYASDTPRSITYTSRTTINNLLGTTADNVNTRLVLTLTSGTGFVIDTDGNPANNNNGDIQKLIRIAGNAFSLRVDITSNMFNPANATLFRFGPSNSHVYNAIPKPPNPPGSVTAVDMGFYYLLCAP
jgi:hypothetical protein